LAPSRLLDVHNLDDGGVADAVQRHDGVATSAVAHALGVLNGRRQDLVSGVRVSGTANKNGQKKSNSSRAADQLRRSKAVLAGVSY
jgi:hypothetical protein